MKHLKMNCTISRLHRINEIIGLGTGAVEIKSGYGLNTEDELKMLRVIRTDKGKYTAGSKINIPWSTCRS